MGGPADYLTGGGRFFCRLCGAEIRSLFDLGMGHPGPPDHFHCPRCEGRALDEYTLLLNLGIFGDTHSLCPCGTARPLWDRAARFCFRCGRASGA